MESGPPARSRRASGSATEIGRLRTLLSLLVTRIFPKIVERHEET
jgi:hypothetical protein